MVINWMAWVGCCSRPDPFRQISFRNRAGGWDGRAKVTSRRGTSVRFRTRVYPSEPKAFPSKT